MTTTAEQDSDILSGKERDKDGVGREESPRSVSISEDLGLGDIYRHSTCDSHDASPITSRSISGRRFSNVSNILLGVGGIEKEDSGVVDMTPLATTQTSLINSGGQSVVSSTSASRRPSIVEVMSGDTLKGLRSESGELNFESISAHDLEMLYQLNQTRRGSLPSDHLQDARLAAHPLNLFPKGTSETDLGGYSPSCDPRHWWEPHFNSKVLENHWNKKVTEFLHRRYRIALVFIGFFALLWIVFFSVQLPVTSTQAGDFSTTALSSNFLALQSVKYSPGYIIGGVVVFLIILLLLCLTFWKHYRKIAQLLSVVLTLLLTSSSCALAIGLHLDNSAGISTISFVAQFAISAIVVLVVYTLSRLGIWVSVIICSVYMIILESLSISLRSISAPQYFNTTSTNTDYLRLFSSSTASRILFHIALNVAGVTTAYLSHIRLHDTFWRIGQCVLARRLMDIERDIEEKTVHSLLPRAFADNLLSAQVQLMYMIDQEVHRADQAIHPLLKTVSIPFKFCSMDRVSILFADIVGFTSFSSSLSAAELVGILNEIFSEFDELAERNKCEKVTTLGDSYICVSGCPKQDSAHADNCVEMGLSIVKSLDEYCVKTRHPIRMRIGIHSGSVICGVVGTKRFRFDVWSKDVTIANRIESVGMAGRVVISSSTKSYLSSLYITEDYPVESRPIELQGLRLYLASRYRRRSSTSIGSTTTAWKQRIKEIESVAKSGKENNGDESHVELLERRRSSGGVLEAITDTQPTISLRDSLSRQSHLQQCASYTNEINPGTNVREESLDRKIVELMEAEKVNFDSYFDPRLRFLTASFSDRDLEARYRNHGRDILDPLKGTGMETELGFHLTKLSYLVDVVALYVVFLLIMAGSAISLSGGMAFLSDNLYQSWLIVLILGLITHTLILVGVTAVYAPRRFPIRFAILAQHLLNWYIQSFVAIYLIYYPMCIVILTLTQCYGSGFNSVEDLMHVQMSLYVTIIVLISSINFMKLSYIAKVVGSVCSTALTVVLIAAVHLHRCESKLPQNETTSTTFDNRTIFRETQVMILKTYYNHHITPEAVIILLLILTILTVVNSMSEISVRLSFISRITAAVNKQSTHQQKNQVEWLLYNIIPPHVALELRNTGRYSCNHDCVGVIFASIVNFNDLRSEGDESCFLLLNRIVREYDTLLDKNKFSLIDKIKTIGSTYMAASGLNMPVGAEKTSHLVQLVNFSLQLHDVLRQINILVPGFLFRLRIGFNYGPVTSGVVGSRKLMYDIWGDTVNVASRMDSTGRDFKIHMPEKCLELMEPFVTWEFNQVVDVKGKGSMRTVFVTGRK